MSTYRAERGASSWTRLSGVVRFLAAAVWLGSGQVYAQPPPGPGIRAAGLAEAFVAVADDASAVYWNPAGLAVGGLFSSVIERAQADTRTGETSAQRFETRLMAVAVPSFGVSYYRQSTRQALGGARPPFQRDEVPQPVAGVALVADHYGATVLQSLLQDLVVGTTLRYVRGRTGRDVWPAGTPPGEVVGDLTTTGSAQGTFDLDVGVLVSIGVVRVGYVGRNLREPEFDVADAESIRLDREHRLGVAIVPDARWVVAIDADLTSTVDELGERQRASVGVERWLLQKRVGVRGGFAVNTRDSAQRSASVGGSVRLGQRFFLEGYYRTSDRAEVSAWGVGGRVGY